MQYESTVWNHLFGEVWVFFSFGAMGYNVTYILFWNESLFFGVSFVNVWPVSRHNHVISICGNAPSSRLADSYFFRSCNRHVWVNKTVESSTRLCWYWDFDRSKSYGNTYIHTLFNVETHLAFASFQVFQTAIYSSQCHYNVFCVRYSSNVTR